MQWFSLGRDVPGRQLHVVTNSVAFVRFVLDKHDPLKHNSLTMNRLSKKQRTKIISALVEGNSAMATFGRGSRLMRIQS